MTVAMLTPGRSLEKHGRNRSCLRFDSSSGEGGRRIRMRERELAKGDKRTELAKGDKRAPLAQS